MTGLFILFYVLGVLMIHYFTKRRVWFEALCWPIIWFAIAIEAVVVEVDETSILKELNDE